jgi:hypothetical protein
MSSVKWVIEDFEPDNSFGKLADEVKRQGMDCEVIRYLPLQSGSYNIFGDTDCVLFQGSIELALQLQRQKPWVPGPWLTAKNYECTTYYNHYGKYLFNDPYIFVTKGELLRRFEWLRDKAFGDILPFNKNNYFLFFRPNSGLKPFIACVQDVSSKSGFVSSWWPWVEQFMEPSDIIVVSTAKDILKECRFVCAEHEIIAGCQYRKGVKSQYDHGYPDEAKILADIIARESYQPDPMFIIDICQGADEQYYLLEINSFSCGGLYACEMEPIVKKASEIALREWKNINTI